MTWSLIGTATTSTAVTSGNVTGTESVGTAQGDLLVAVVSARSTAAFTLPSGWTIVGTQQSSGDTATTLGIASGLICAIARGVSAPDLVWVRTAGDRGQVRVHTFRSSNAAVTLNQDGSSTTTQGASGTSISVAGFTTTVAGDLIVFGVAVGDNGTVSSYANTTAALTWNTIAGAGDNTGADGGTSSAWGVQAAAGATGSFTATSSISNRPAVLIGSFKEPAAPVGASIPPIFHRPLRGWQRKF